MANMNGSYSSKSTAVRGAQRMGLAEDAFIVEKNAEGRWIILVIPSKADEDEFEASEAELAVQQGRPSTEETTNEPVVQLKVEGAEDLEPGTHTIQVESVRKVRGKNAVRVTAKVVEEVEVVATTKGRAALGDASKTPAYKQMARLAKSEVEKPLATIHAFLDANPTLTRKQAVAALVDKGINFYTARTQYQKWFTNKKVAK